MKFIKIDRLPDREKRPYNKMEEELEKFLRMGCRYAKVDLCGEYSGVNSARASICNAIKMYDLPIQARLINEELYLISTDID